MAGKSLNFSASFTGHPPRLRTKSAQRNALKGPKKTAQGRARLTSATLGFHRPSEALTAHPQGHLQRFVPGAISLTERLWPPTQKLTLNEGDDSLDLTLDVAVCPELIRWVASWREDVQVTRTDIAGRYADQKRGRVLAESRGSAQSRRMASFFGPFCDGEEAPFDCESTSGSPPAPFA